MECKQYPLLIPIDDCLVQGNTHAIQITWQKQVVVIVSYCLILNSTMFSISYGRELKTNWSQRKNILSQHDLIFINEV